MHRKQFGFSTITWKFNHSIGSLSGLIMTILVILSSSVYNGFSMQRESFWGLGVDHRRNLRINSPYQPTPIWLRLYIATDSRTLCSQFQLGHSEPAIVSSYSAQPVPDI